MNNQLLNRKLKLAIKYRIQPEDIGDVIDDEPVVNTLKEGNREAFLMSDFVIKKNTSFDVDNAQHFMYWKLKEEKSSVKVAGIAWMKNGEILLFDGEILAP